jgi:hypothetical protein
MKPENMSMAQNKHLRMGMALNSIQTTFVLCIVKVVGVTRPAIALHAVWIMLPMQSISKTDILMMHMKDTTTNSGI